MSIALSLLLLCAIVAVIAFPAVRFRGPPRFPRPFNDTWQDVYCLRRKCEGGPRLADCSTSEIVGGHAAIDTQFVPESTEADRLTTTEVAFPFPTTTEETSTVTDSPTATMELTTDYIITTATVELTTTDDIITTTDNVITTTDDDWLETVRSFVRQELGSSVEYNEGEDSEEEADALNESEATAEWLDEAWGSCNWRWVIRLFCQRHRVPTYACEPALLVNVHAGLLCVNGSDDPSSLCESLAQACREFHGEGDDYEEERREGEAAYSPATAWRSLKASAFALRVYALPCIAIAAIALMLRLAASLWEQGRKEVRA